MTPKQVQRKRQSISDKIDKLVGQLCDLRETCIHPNVTKQYRGDTGNYDPSQDSYWINWHCPDCGKLWTTPQDRENNLKPGIVIR